jgi:hypothetical protein
MSRMALRPTAGPLDLFAPDEVRGSEGDSLAGLADGLAQFNAGLQSYGSAALAEQKQEGMAAASKAQLERQYKSIGEMEEAVKRGDLPEDANPWKMVFLRQLVARDEVRTGLLRIEQEFEAGATDEVVGVRRAQSVETLDKWVGQRIAALTEGMDPFTSQAAFGAIDDWKTRFYPGVENRWQKERAVATDAGFQREIGHLLEPLAYSARSGVDQPEKTQPYWAGIQSVIDNASRVISDPEQVRRNALQAVAATAIAARTPELVQQSLDKITVGGKTLRELALPGEIAKIEEDIADFSYREMTRQRLAEQVADERATDEVLGQFTAARRQALQNGTFVDPTQFEVDVSRLAPDQQVRANQLMKALTAPDVMRSALATANGVDPTSRQYLTAVEMIASSGAPGADEAVQTLLRVRQIAESRRYPQTSDAEASTEIMRMYTDASVPVEQKLYRVEKMVGDGLLTYADAQQARTTLMSLNRVDRSPATMTLNRYIEQTKNEMMLSIVRTPEYQQRIQTASILGEPGGFPFDLSLEIENKTLELSKTFERLFAANPNPTQQEIEAALDTAKARIIGPGPMTPQQSSVSNAVLRANTDIGASADAGEVVWNGKNFDILVDGSPTAAPGLMPFKTADELIGGWQSLAERLQIPEAKRADFAVAQALRLPAEDRLRVHETLKAEFYGQEIVDESHALADDLQDLYRDVGEFLTTLDEAKGYTGRAARVGRHIAAWENDSLVQTWVGYYLREAEALERVEEYRKLQSDITEVVSNLKALPNGVKDVEAARKLLQGKKMKSE